MTALLHVSCSQPESVELQVWVLLGRCYIPKQLPSRLAVRGRGGCLGPPVCRTLPTELHYCATPRADRAVHPATCAQEVEIEFAGIERVDASWVLPAYRRSTAPINSDKRKVGTFATRWSKCIWVLLHCSGRLIGWRVLITADAGCALHLLQVQRYVVQSRLQAATQGTFSDLSLRRFVVRCARRPPGLFVVEARAIF